MRLRLGRPAALADCLACIVAFQRATGIRPAFGDQRLHHRMALAMPGNDIIGMTNLTEAKLAREAGICYATLALVTDYDCWHQGTEPVTVEMVVANLTENVATSKELLRRIVPSLGQALGQNRDCPCASSLKDAIITRKEEVPADLRQKLAPIAGRYLG